MNCARCNEPVAPKVAWPEYRGWARPSGAKGDHSGSSLIDRQPTGRVICGDCAMDLIHGTDPNQESLIA